VGSKVTPRGSVLGSFFSVVSYEKERTERESKSLLVNEWEGEISEQRYREKLSLTHCHEPK